MQRNILVKSSSETSEDSSCSSFGLGLDLAFKKISRILNFFKFTKINHASSNIFENRKKARESKKLNIKLQFLSS